MNTTILVLDPGSSSLKFGLYSCGPAASRRADTPYKTPSKLASGTIERIGSPQALLKLEVSGRPVYTQDVGGRSFEECTEIAIEKVQEVGGTENVAAVGCRVVHGGDRFTGPTQVTQEVLEAIRALSPLAPLHNPVAAEVLDACFSRLSNIPLVAVFDTSFHRTMPDVARTYALPFEMCAEYHRFGFHGIAHRFVSARLIESIAKAGQDSRCITCHTGNGASICAVKNGASIDTSMGMTPLEGLVMGTRSGDIDPGLLLYLLRTTGMSPEDLEELVEHKSGLLGLSGISADMRDIEIAASKGDSHARLALELFAYRAAKTIGAYVVALNGLDALAFSGGIGEHSAGMRHRICGRLGCLGIKLDEVRNDAVAPGDPARISADDSPAQVWVIPADEDLQIAWDVMKHIDN